MQLNPAYGPTTSQVPNSPQQAGDEGRPTGASFVGPYANPNLTAEQRGFESGNRTRRLEKDLARYGFLGCDPRFLGRGPVRP